MKAILSKAVLSCLVLFVAVSVSIGQANDADKADKQNTLRANKLDKATKDKIAKAINSVAVIGGVELDYNTTNDEAQEEVAIKSETVDDSYNSNDFDQISNDGINQTNPIKIVPNPMVTSSTIRFFNPDKTPVKIDIYNSVGELVFYQHDVEDSEFKITKDYIPEGIYYVKIKKKKGEEDDDDDDDGGEISVRNGSLNSDIQVYTAKLVVN